jgi:hypothetical protein
MVKIMSSQRKLKKGYGKAGTKIVAAVAIFGIILVFSVALGMKALEPIPEQDEYLWFKVTAQENITVSMLATAYVYSVNYTLLEQFLLLNTTGWQRSNDIYLVGANVLIFVDFWDIEASISDVVYRIGRSPLLIFSLEEVEINIISDWSEPLF